MSSSGRLRERYGAAYLSRLPIADVAWKPLSVGEFLRYTSDFAAQFIPEHILEEEIFKKCVLDRDVSKNQELPAGVVPATVAGILAYSGPSSGEEFNQQLALARQVASDSLHESVTWITRAFPAYKPEDVYALDYPTFMLRLAQAERLLLKIGAIQTPFEIIKKEEKAKKNSRISSRNLKDVWEQSTQGKQPTPGQSRVLEALKEGKHAISSKDVVTSNTATLIGDEERTRLVAEAQVLYKDVLDKMPVQPLRAVQKEKEDSVLERRRKARRR